MTARIDHKDYAAVLKSVGEYVTDVTIASDSFENKALGLRVHTYCPANSVYVVTVNRVAITVTPDYRRAILTYTRGKAVTDEEFQVWCNERAMIDGECEQ